MQKKANSNVMLIICKWFLKSKMKLPIGKIFHQIASKEVVNKIELRNFEKLSCQLAALEYEYELE